MLTGQALVAFVKANENLNETQLAKGAGYVRVTDSGREMILVKQMYEELLAAQGMRVKGGRSPGKTAQYRTTVHRSGVILIGKTYSKRFGLESGDQLEIVLEDDCIKLVPRDDEGVQLKALAA